MNIAVILSGGIGSRMKTGGIPKQYLLLNDRPIISLCMQTFNQHHLIDKIIVVADKNWHKLIDEWIKKENINKFYAYAEPGESRQLSILNSLKLIQTFAGEDDLVVIHEAARPLITPELISRCLEAMGTLDGVLPVLPAKDTYYLSDTEGKVVNILPRSLLVAGQAPEIFKFGMYYRANLSASYEDMLRYSGGVELAMRYGMHIGTVEGEEKNLKLTTQNDLLWLENYIKQ